MAEAPQALADQKVPVEMVVYRGFGHIISRPKALRASVIHNLMWFGHYLWQEPAPDFSAPVLPQSDHGRGPDPLPRPE